MQEWMDSAGPQRNACLLAKYVRSVSPLVKLSPKKLQRQLEQSSLRQIHLPKRELSEKIQIVKNACCNLRTAASNNLRTDASI